jgi:hypothetical protein
MGRSRRVLLDVTVKDGKQPPVAGDQKMVQALPAHGTDPALGDGVGVRRLDRCAEDAGADRQVPACCLNTSAPFGNQKARSAQRGCLASGQPRYPPRATELLAGICYER